MADETKIGTHWRDDELDAIVADYFAMLTADLSRQPYVKSRHSAALMAQIGRTHRSVEFKHQNISAVLFSASGTISKFNRLGRQAGFKAPGVVMVRTGTYHDHNPNAHLPRPFMYVVDEKAQETWAEGLSMFHNPNALHAVPEELFPTIAHHRFRDGQILSVLPKFHTYASLTINMVDKE